MTQVKPNYEEQRFLSRRARLVQAWPLVGAILLGLTAGLVVWMYFTNPLLVDPFRVLARLQTDTIPGPTLRLMAALVPILVLLCVALAIALLVFAYASFANERRYLAIVQRSLGGTEGRGQGPAAPANDPLRDAEASDPSLGRDGPGLRGP